MRDYEIYAIVAYIGMFGAIILLFHMIAEKWR